MTILAHLSDLHLLEDDLSARDSASRARLAYLTFGRVASPRRRRLRAQRALSRARAAGASHVVLTGDLTEDGHPGQFEVLAEVLASSGFAPSQITLLPGNHDAYIAEDAFDRALDGPLSKYKRTSYPGCVVHLPGAILVGLSTAFHQSYLRSSGRLEPSQVAIAAAAARVAWNRGEAVIVGLHHPPEARLMKAIAWIDGLAGHESLLDVMRAHDHVFALHGHTHVAADRAVRSGAVARIFSAPSVVSHESPLRLYRVRGGLVTPEVEPERVERPSLAAAF